MIEGYTNKDDARLRRRIDRFKRSGLLEPLDGSITIKQASTLQEFTEAYALVHEVFVSQGYIKPQTGGLRLRIFEALPEMGTFIAKVHGRVVGVMSMVPDSPDLGLPSDQVFGQELGLLRDAGRRVGEITNLAVTPEHRHSAIFFELSRCCNAYARHLGLDDVFVSISPGHGMFFETILRFEHWGDRRSYSRSHEDIVEGKRLNMQTLEQNLREVDRALGSDAFLHAWFFSDNYHFRHMAASADDARQQFLQPTLLERLFVHASGFLNRFGHGSHHHLRALKMRWGTDRYEAVFEAALSTAASCAA